MVGGAHKTWSIKGGQPVRVARPFACLAATTAKLRMYRIENLSRHAQIGLPSRHNRECKAAVDVSWTLRGRLTWTLEASCEAAQWPQIQCLKEGNMRRITSKERRKSRAYREKNTQAPIRVIEQISVSVTATLLAEVLMKMLFG